MFFFEIERACLIFENDSIKLELIPCEVGLIIDSNDSDDEVVDNGQHHYRSNPKNGKYGFYYDKNQITFTSSGYGNGQGGALYITIKMTDEILKSLEESLKEMRLYAFGG